MRGAPGSREDPGCELLTAARRLSPGAAPAGGRPRGAVSGGTPNRVRLVRGASPSSRPCLHSLYKCFGSPCLPVGRTLVDSNTDLWEPSSRSYCWHSYGRGHQQTRNPRHGGVLGGHPGSELLLCLYSICCISPRDEFL